MLIDLTAEAFGQRLESLGELFFKGHFFDVRIMAERSENDASRTHDPGRFSGTVRSE
ncbi:MAG: hypothetical protein ACRD2I_04190 [Vicinamibacterales bacterium]